MKLLMVHNEYGKYSGEEAVVDRMAEAFRERGVEVAMLRRSSAGARESLMGKIHGFFAGIYSPGGVGEMRRILREVKPDVVNVHNVFPFISPAALQECRKAGVPVVMTIHNYRLVCPTGLFMRDGGPCERCLERGSEWGCVKYNCEGSRLKSLGYALRGATARWRRDFIDCVDRFACITDFQRRKLSQAGFDPAKITVIPNAVDVPAEAPDFYPGGYVAYCGRLSREKGVDLIIEAARRLPKVEFRLAGAVRDAELIENLPANVKLCGFIGGKDLDEFFRGARLVVMASRCYEGFAVAILEAAQHGRCVVAPDHGGFTEIIGRDDSAIGRLFTPGDASELVNAISSIWDDSDTLSRLGRAAYDKLCREYSLEVVTESWMSLFSELTRR